MKETIQPPDIKVRKSGLIVDSQVVVGVLKVSPLNLDLKTDTEQDGLHQFYQNLLDTISYPVYIYTRQTPADLDNYMAEIGSRETHNRLRSSFLRYCGRVAQDEFVETEHFIVIRVTAGGDESIKKRLMHRVREIKASLAGRGLDVTHLKGSELKAFAREALNKSPNPTEEFCAIPCQGFSEYRKLLYIEEYPSTLEFGWPRHLLRVDGLVDITQVVEPIDVGKATHDLTRQAEKLDAEISVFQSKGYRGVNNLEQSLDDTEWFLDLLARQDCRPVKFGVYVTAHASSQAELRETLNRVKSQLRALRTDFQEPGYRNDHAYFTDSPFYPDRLSESFLMPSVSAATGFLFGNQPYRLENGVLYGVDTEDRVPILLDRFSWDSHSMAVIGTLGSGKSYLAHLELMRSLLAFPELRIIVLDPKKEYRSTVQAVGGEARFLEHGKDYRFDQQVLSFEPWERGEFENVTALVELVEQIYAAVSKHQEKTLVLVDEAHNLLRDDVGRRVLNKLVLEARDIDTAVHMISQTGAHWTDYPEGEDILRVVPGKIFFRHEQPPEYFTLPEEEAAALLELKSGNEAGKSEAYLYVSEVVNTKIEIESTPVEHQIIEDQAASAKPREVIE